MEIKDGYTFFDGYYVALHLKQYVTVEISHLLYSRRVLGVTRRAPHLSVYFLIKSDFEAMFEVKF